MISTIHKLYIDIHSHQDGTTDTLTISNMHRCFTNTVLPSYFSAGLHPQYINKHWQSEFALLRELTKNVRCLAIGECGLDKVSNTDLLLQQEVFIAQVQWANEIRLPLIIHCVRAFEEVQHLLKQCSNHVPVIFHGFNKSKEQAKQLLQKGFFLSFGKSILNESVIKYFATMPLDHIFLETDHSGLSIHEMYQNAAAILNISEEQLSLQLQKNTEQVFNIRL